MRFFRGRESERFLACGFCNGGEGEVACVAAGLLFPLLEEASVAHGHAVGGGYAELVSDAVDPFGRALEFGEDSDGGFVENAVS